VELAGCQSYVGDVYVRTVVGHESKNGREDFRWQYDRRRGRRLSHGLMEMSLESGSRRSTADIVAVQFPYAQRENSRDQRRIVQTKFGKLSCQVCLCTEEEELRVRILMQMMFGPWSCSHVHAVGETLKVHETTAAARLGILV
jgi:hypothetical protein